MRERVLITVKTYPVLSRKYAELVCTAGVTEAGEWRRLYPIQFRQLQDGQKYRKYQWVEADIEKSDTDDRPESFKIVGDSLRTLGPPLSTARHWAERKRAFSDKVECHERLDPLIARAHRNELSLALFKPARILRFEHEETAREWDRDRLDKLELEKRQLRLFEDEESVARQFEVVKKLPYKFYYRFEDADGKPSRLMIEDWEIGVLFFNCLDAAGGDEKAALEKVRQKYWTEFVESGRYEMQLILGTTLEHHRKRAPNPFVIVGIFNPLHNPQGELF